MERVGAPEVGRSPPLIRSDATHHVRRFLTPLHGVSLAAGDMERVDAQGTLTLWFHENRDKAGNPSTKVFGVTNCHVLRRNPTVDYEHRGDAPMSYVRICGGRRFDRGLNEITDEIANRAMAADVLTREIATLQLESADDNAEKIREKQWDLGRETKAVNDLLAFHLNVTTNWSHIGLHHNIGYTQFAPAITVDEGGSRFTSDWGVFVAAEGKVKDAFEGNVVFLGAFQLFLSPIHLKKRNSFF